MVASSFLAADEFPHPGLIDEWVFAAWSPDCSVGIVSGHRLLGRRAWYWSAMVEVGRPVLHLTEFEVVVRAADPFIVKAPQMWAQHQLDAPLEQWSLGNEGFFVALDRPSDAVGRAYGEPTPVAMDLEWYATELPTALNDPDEVRGYHQHGVVHGTIELMHRANIELVEAPAHRWRRWGPTLGRLADESDAAAAGRGRTAAEVRLGEVPFGFPDGTTSYWTLSESGFRPG